MVSDVFGYRGGQTILPARRGQECKSAAALAFEIHTQNRIGGRWSILRDLPCKNALTPPNLALTGHEHRSAEAGPFCRHRVQHKRSATALLERAGSWTSGLSSQCGVTGKAAAWERHHGRVPISRGNGGASNVADQSTTSSRFVPRSTPAEFPEHRAQPQIGVERSVR